MADSNITKQALASSLKELMEEVPFEKISVAQICERCNMNRKSFYYHFKDKYDLVNWIFDTEFIKIATFNADLNDYENRRKMIESTCTYFYENRVFYRKAFQIKGQNSFQDHFKELITPIMRNYLLFLIQDDEPEDFFLDLFTDLTIETIVHWISQKNCIPADEFCKIMRRYIENEVYRLANSFKTRDS